MFQCPVADTGQKAELGTQGIGSPGRCVEPAMQQGFAVDVIEMGQYFRSDIGRQPASVEKGFALDHDNVRALVRWLENCPADGIRGRKVTVGKCGLQGLTVDRQPGLDAVNQQADIQAELLHIAVGVKCQWQVTCQPPAQPPGQCEAGKQ